MIIDYGPAVYGINLFSLQDGRGQSYALASRIDSQHEHDTDSAERETATIRTAVAPGYQEQGEKELFSELLIMLLVVCNVVGQWGNFRRIVERKENLMTTW